MRILLIILALFALTSCAVVPGRATIRVKAAPAPSPVYKCRAFSPYAVGYGWGITSGVAARRAMAECVMRTPHYALCRLHWCNRIR
jgi:hypothetical protein